MTVYSYTRVSTLRQSEEGESLGAQEQRLVGYAMMNQWTIAEAFVERGVSGSVPLHDRPEGARLLAGLNRGDVIICCKLDRCFRSALDALKVVEQFKAMGVELHLLDLGGNVCGNGLGKLMLTIASAFAEAERDRIQERAVETKRYQRSQGKFLGGSVPFGYRLGDAGKLVEHDGEQGAIAKMHELKCQGKPLRAISAEMKAAGFDISFRGVANVLDRAASGTH